MLVQQCNLRKSIDHINLDRKKRSILNNQGLFEAHSDSNPLSHYQVHTVLVQQRNPRKPIDHTSLDKRKKSNPNSRRLFGVRSDSNRLRHNQSRIVLHLRGTLRIRVDRIIRA